MNSVRFCRAALNRSVLGFLCCSIVVARSAGAESFYPSLNDERVILSGYAQTVWVEHDGQVPSFLDDTGQEHKVRFSVGRASAQWQRLTLNGKAHVNLIGYWRNHLLYVAGVERYGATKEDSMEVLRFEAHRAWLSMSESMVNAADVSRGSALRMRGNLVFARIESGEDQDLFRSLIDMGQFVKHGLSNGQIETLLNAVNELFSIAEPNGLHILRRNFKRSSEHCSRLLSQSEKQAAYRDVVRRLELLLERGSN